MVETTTRFDSVVHHSFCMSSTAVEFDNIPEPIFSFCVASSSQDVCERDWLLMLRTGDCITEESSGGCAAVGVGVGVRVLYDPRFLLFATAILSKTQTILTEPR